MEQGWGRKVEENQGGDDQGEARTSWTWTLTLRASGRDKFNEELRGLN